MFGVRRETVERLRREYPVGCRVELVQMDDVQAPPIGTKGTVRGVDDIGSFAFTCGMLTLRSSSVPISRSCFCAFLSEGICSIWAITRPYMKLSKRFANSSLSSK